MAIGVVTATGFPQPFGYPCLTKRSNDLLVATDPDWVNVILDNFDEFLRDHANCERKASALAMSLVVKHPDKTRIIPTLISLAQEELEHFGQVYELMHSRGLSLLRDTPDPYVNQLMAVMRHGIDERFLDRLLVSSLVECRGAERFRIISEALDDPVLKDVYDRFWKCEAKHGHQFVDMVLHYFDKHTVYARLDELARHEAAIIQKLAWRPSLH